MPALPHFKVGQHIFRKRGIEIVGNVKFAGAQAKGSFAQDVVAERFDLATA